MADAIHNPAERRWKAPRKITAYLDGTSGFGPTSVIDSALDSALYGNARRQAIRPAFGTRNVNCAGMRGRQLIKYLQTCTTVSKIGEALKGRDNVH